MPILKTLSKATKLEREKFTIPRSVQDAIPIQRIWPDGVFQIGSRFSKTFSFTDINYSIAGKDDKTAMFLDYSELLNSLDSGASAKITIHNRRVNKEEFERSLLLPMKEDGLDHFRKEYNEMLLSKVTGVSNSVVQDRYITITVAKKTIDEARTYFSRVGTDLITHLRTSCLSLLYRIAIYLTSMRKLPKMLYDRRKKDSDLFSSESFHYSLFSFTTKPLITISSVAKLFCA